MKNFLIYGFMLWMAGIGFMPLHAQVTYPNPDIEYHEGGTKSEILIDDLTIGNETIGTLEKAIDSRPRIRLRFSSPLGYYRQIMVGLDEYATNDYDVGFDAPLIEDNQEDMYWMINDRKFVIQGVSNFSEDQRLPLGLKIGEAGKARIEIDTLENIDENIKMFIFDKEQNTTVEITNGFFEIQLSPGFYDDRFELVFKSALKTINELSLELGVTSYMNNRDDALMVNRSIEADIYSVEVFNILGQRVARFAENLHELQLRLPLQKSEGAYFVKINTNHGQLNNRIIIR